MEGCLLGNFPRPTKRKVGTKVIGLALALAKRKVAMTWKSTSGIPVETWVKDVFTWARAEGCILRWEDAQGIRRQSLTELGLEVLEGWDAPPELESDDEPDIAGRSE
ncbi:hypothetical protein NDU88_002999 [Pleurodeles waltl]|uniref:Uncharacterized protein n=1 Tax=Pleurodeles waltl TaxID=8319 RepID=A0AAV7KXP9_PLEWA|nr:hypothetical protein NDU88_002999 [Pleurodeles waltl]